jgi:putative ABC transport system permease protein
VNWLGRLFRRREQEAQLDSELRFHVEQQTAENITAGMNPDEARRRALALFGGLEYIKEETRDARGTHFLETVFQDFRFALRMLRKSPGFTAIAILTLALGIGANAAIFSVLDQDLLHPLPYPHADRLVFFGMLLPSFDSRPFLFTSSYLQLATENTPFDSMASWGPGVTACDLTEAQPLRLACARAQSTFLPTFGVNPILGRNFTTEEDGPDAPPVCLISYALWQSRFGGSTAAINHWLSIDGQATRIIGVLPPNFEWPTLTRIDIILPEAISAAERTNAMAGVVRAYARLKPGVTMEQARAELEPALESWRRASPPMFRKEMRLELISVREDQVGSIRPALLVLFGASLALLLLAAANVANLFLARGAAREHELGVRAALGASRSNLILLQLSESALLGFFAGTVGAGLAYALLQFFVAVAPVGIPRIAQAGLGAPVLLFIVVASLLSGLICGLPPALAARPLRTLLAGRSLGRPRARLGAVLVAAQVAVSFVLVTGAGLFLDTLRNIENVPLGMDTNHIVTAEINLGSAYQSPGVAAEFFERLEAGLCNLPGVTGVAVSDSLPPTGGGHARSFFDLRVEGRPPFPKGVGGLVAWSIVSPGYFKILSIPIVEGRGFLPGDQDPNTNVVIVSRKLAARLFPQESAIGQHVQLSTPSGPWYTVVGVAGDVKYLNASGRVGRADPAYYVPWKHSLGTPARASEGRHAFFVVRSPLKSTAVERLVRGEIASLDPTLPAQISTLDARVENLRVQPRFNAALISLFAVTGFVLVTIGVFGLLSFMVSSRTREIGLRIALGAAPRDVLTMIVWHGIRLMLAGLVVGVALAFAVAHLLQSLLYGVSPEDPVIASIAALLLLLAGLVACYIPSRRAMRVDPMVALRYE